MAKTDYAVAEIVRQLEHVFNSDRARPVGGLTGECQLRPGMVLPPADNFGDCESMLFLIAQSRFKTESFPSAVIASNCRGRLVAEFTAGVIRCSQALGYDGGLPSAETMASEFATQEDDKDRLWFALCQAGGALVEDDRAVNVGFGPVEVLGPEGGSVAVYQQIIIELRKTR